MYHSREFPTLEKGQEKCSKKKKRAAEPLQETKKKKEKKHPTLPEGANLATVLEY